jgi:hypothetical protein
MTILRTFALLIPMTFNVIAIKAYALISTSTPEGRSNFDNASTVLDEEV